MWPVIIAGILLNASSLVLKKIRGIDAMPALPIIAGYTYGADAGLFAGAVIAASYYIFNFSMLHYSPLTVLLNAAVGFIAGFLSGIDFFIAGMILLCFYHLVSGFIVSLLGGLKPGYFTFVIVNFIASAVIFYVSSFAL